MSREVELLIVGAGVIVAAYILIARAWQRLRGSRCGGCSKCADDASSEPADLVQLESPKPKRS